MSWSITSRHKRGLGTAWDKLRLIVLRRDNGLCQCDQCQGGLIRLVIANEVHHIVGRESGKSRGWTQAQIDAMSNLMSVSHDCHKRLDAQAQGKTLRERVTTGADGWPQPDTPKAGRRGEWDDLIAR